MDHQTASDLIRKIWDIGEYLKTVQRELDVVEGVIADMVEDDV